MPFKRKDFGDQKFGLFFTYRYDFQGLGTRDYIRVSKIDASVRLLLAKILSKSLDKTLTLGGSVKV